MDTMLLPPDMALHGLDAVKGASRRPLAASAVAKRRLAVSAVHGDGDWLLPISGIMTMPMVATRHRQHQQADSQPQGQGLDAGRSAGFLVAVQQLVKQRVLDSFLRAQYGGPAQGTTVNATSARPAG